MSASPPGYPPLPGIPQYGETITWIYFVSALLWVPYTFYLFYCFWQSRKRNLFPQAFIHFLLAMGTAVRCIWFYLAAYYVGSPGIDTLNRIAILLQFSAVTLVMLMWSRAFKMAEINDGNRRSRQPSSLGRSGTGHGLAPLAHGSTNGMSSSGMNALGANKVIEAQRLRMVAQHHVMLQRKFICLALNFIVWFVILFTLLYHFSYSHMTLLYQSSEVFLSCCCLFVSIGILVIGMNNYNRIRSELQPVYVLAGTKEETKHVFTAFLRFLLGYLDIANEHTLQAQTQILRTICKVSIVVSVFYAIRAFLYIWTIYYSATSLPLYIFPLLFFQFPEFFPNIVIVRGISVSTGYGKPPTVNSNGTMLEILYYKIQAYVHLCFRLICCYCVTPVLQHRVSSVDSDILPYAVSGVAGAGAGSGNIIDGYDNMHSLQWPSQTNETANLGTDGSALAPTVENPMNSRNSSSENKVDSPQGASGMRKVPHNGNMAAADRSAQSSRTYSDISGLFIDGDSASGSLPKLGTSVYTVNSGMTRVHTSDFSRVNSHTMSRVNTTGTGFDGLCRVESSFGYTGRPTDNDQDRESEVPTSYIVRNSGYFDDRESSLAAPGRRGANVDISANGPNHGLDFDHDPDFVDTERNSIQLNPVIPHGK